MVERSEHTIRLDWERRADTEWTIAVFGYEGTESRLSHSAIFAESLAGYRAARSVAPALATYSPISASGVDSMTNWPNFTIRNVSRPDEGAEVEVALVAEYGNQGVAAHPHTPELIAWNIDGAIHLALMWSPPSGDVACPDIYQPVSREINARFTLPSETPHVFLAVPNVPKDEALPIDIRAL